MFINLFGMLRMKNNIFVIKHQNEIPHSKSFFLLQIPNGLFILFSTTIILIVLAFLLILFVPIDDVVRASGVVHPLQNISSINNVIAGKLTALYYKPGQIVRKGDLLYKLDDSVYEARKRSLLTEGENLSNKLQGLNYLIESYEIGENIIPGDMRTAYTRFVEYQAQREQLNIQFLIAQQTYSEISSMPSIQRTQSKIEYALNEKNLSLANLNSFDSTFVAELYREKDDVSLLLEQNFQNLLELESEFEFLKVYSPMDGIVQEFSSLNVGDYIASNEEVLNIVPNDKDAYRVEIQVKTKDIGRITPGLKVKYRLRAFPFFEYQGADGVITAIDPDARTDVYGNLYYCVYADIDKLEFSNRKGEKFSLRSGLDTDVHIVLGTSTVLKFLLRKINFIY